MISQFLADHATEILLTVVTAAVMGFCRYLLKELKNYKKLVEEKQDKEVETMIDEKIKPLTKELEELRVQLQETRDIEHSHITLVIAAYRFALIQLCKMYMRQGYMTNIQFEQLTEFYKIYIALGGDTRVQDYFEKACELEIRNDNALR